MLLGDIVNLFIGLSLTFALIGLLVSTAVEALASILHWRSATLIDGLKQLLNDPDLDGLAGDVLAHGAINPRAPGGADIAANTARDVRPSYIPPRQFANALIDILQNPPKRQGVQLSLDDAVSLVPDAQLRGVLRSIRSRVGSDVERFHQEVADWFDNGMDRLSGAYKRKTQWVSFLVALAFAILLNVDTFRLGSQLWQHFAVIAVTPEQVAKLKTPDEAYRTLLTLPFGWDGDSRDRWTKILWHIPGWIATAVAALYGAPFWFDTLQRFVQLRSTGAAPDQK